MPDLTEDGRERVAAIAARHGVSAETAEHLLDALERSGGGQAQFNAPELGGMGQWSRGGMIMIGDMFNNGLKARVDALCTELSALVSDRDLFRPTASGTTGGGNTGGSGWPAELGEPSSAGSQNDMRYAVFPGTRRLAVASGGTVTVYDTGDHQIGGVSQAQSGSQSLAFTSQHGTVRLSDLKVVGAPGTPAADAPDAAPSPAKPPAKAAAAASPAAVTTSSTHPGAGGEDIVGLIDRLADLRSRGILTDDEFARKKAELLSRL